MADARADVHFVGRLATYKYYNMDQIVAQALTQYGKIVGVKRQQAVQMSRSATANVSSIYIPKVNGNGHGKVATEF